MNALQKFSHLTPETIRAYLQDKKNFKGSPEDAEHLEALLLAMGVKDESVRGIYAEKLIELLCTPEVESLMRVKKDGVIGYYDKESKTFTPLPTKWPSAEEFANLQIKAKAITKDDLLRYLNGEAVSEDVRKELDALCAKLGLNTLEEKKQF